MCSRLVLSLRSTAAFNATDNQDSRHAGSKDRTRQNHNVSLPREVAFPPDDAESSTNEKDIRLEDLESNYVNTVGEYVSLLLRARFISNDLSNPSQVLVTKTRTVQYIQ